MKLLVFIGFVFLSIPFISSFSTNDIDKKQNTSSHWVITIPISDLVEGEIKPLTWQAGLVWVYMRTKKDIESLKNNSLLLQDAASLKSDQPDTMKNDFRSVSESFFVFIPQENKRGCQVSLNTDGEARIFTEPCFNAKYDTAGRIYKNSGHKDQQNLSVPKHIIEDGKLKVGIWTPKI